MVTQTEHLPWDSFLEREVRKDPMASDQMVVLVRKQIDGFREVEWPNIKRDLGQEPFNWEVPDHLEPHWVSPGKAVYWQEHVVREPVWREVDGRSRRVLEDVSYGWKPTDAGLPANNPAMINLYLRKGLRLRPPAEGVELESIVPSGALHRMEEAYTAPPEEVVSYTCLRHGYKPRTFKTWKGYLTHCVARKEPPELEPPQSLLDKAKEFPYFCFVHGVGFQGHRTALRHFRAEAKKPGRSVHPSVDQMKMEAPNA